LRPLQSKSQRRGMDIAWSGPFTPAERRLLASITDGIDRPRLGAIVRRHGETGFGRRKRKYLELVNHIGRAFRDVVRLDLHATARWRVLDIGTGPGAFAHVLEHLGHEVVATERAEDESIMWSTWCPEDALDGFDGPSSGDEEVLGAEASLYADLADFLGVERVIWTVEAAKPAPDLGDRFDLICARNLYFDHPRGNQPVWGLDAWRFFLSDVEARLLAPEGRLFMSLPAGASEREDLLTALKEAGAQVSSRRVLLDRNACCRFIG